MPEEIRQVFEGFGHGCLAAETSIGVVHVCHAADSDIEGFANKPVSCQWQLVKMPTAPLIRLQLTILDRPDNPYRFESFLNVAEEDQARVLAQLAGQDRLYLSFYGDDLSHRFTKSSNTTGSSGSTSTNSSPRLLTTGARFLRSSTTSTQPRRISCGGFREAKLTPRLHFVLFLSGP